MAKLTYAEIIKQDARFQNLADLGLRLEQLDLAKLMPKLLALVSSEHLELLAESRSILNEDGYWLARDDEQRRTLLKQAYQLHRFKGTPWAIREIVRRLGFGEIRIIEGLNGRIYDGQTVHDGLYVYGSRNHWAYYSIQFNQPITNSQAVLLRKTLPAFAPARCVLDKLDYRTAPLRYDGQANFNGDFNHGSA